MKLGLSTSIAVLLAVTLLIGCGKESPEALLASAKTHLAKNDTKAAVIQIKNALQVNPELPEARYLLGAAMLADGNPVSAELELRKAQALKYSADLVVPKLAAAMLAQGQFKKLIDEFAASTLGAAAPTADLQTSIAMAQAGLGNAQASDAALKAAVTADPGFVPALLVRARQQAGRRDFDGALAAAQDIVKRDPASADAWKLKGDILLVSKNQTEQAMADYRKAIEVKSDYLPAHFAIVEILLQQGKVDEAQKQLDQVKTFAANIPQTKYSEGRIAFLRKDFKQARELSLQLLRVARDSPAVLFLVGSVEFQSGNFSQAEIYLVRTLRLAPEAVGARRLLVATYLRSNQVDKALAALRPGQAKDEVAPELYSLAGEVYIRKGDVKSAEEYFSKAAKLDPSDARKRTAVALTHLMGGQSSAAFDELQAIAESDKGNSADVALISTFLRRNEFDKALRAIDALERKQPDQPLAAALRGRTQLALKDTDGARKSFERALTIAPAYFPAAASLAALDMAAKKPDEARKRMDAFLVKNPNNLQASLALSELAALSGGGKDEVAALLGKAIAANPNESAPRLLLIDLYLRNKDLKQAMSTAQNAVAALPDRPEVLDALGQVQQQAGEFNQAIASYTKLIELQPNSPGPHLRMAQVNVAAKNNVAAEQSLRKALEVKPDSLEAQRGLILLALAAAKPQDALAVAHAVQKQRPKEVVGFALEGDIYAAGKDWGAAAAAYRSGLKLASSSELAVNLHSMLLASDKAPEAEKFASAWRKDHPDDAAFLLYLGNMTLLRKDFLAAEQAYLEVKKLQPNNAVVLNNLAWVTGKLNKDGAITYAEKANSLVPNQPAFMDTLAMLLGEAKQYDKAIALQQKAMELQPANSALRLNLAMLYIQSGNKAGARRELDQLAALGAKYPAQAEVTALLKSL